MNLNKSFAELLKQKLTVGSSRSVLLNALPGRLLSRLPLNDLDDINAAYPAQFLDQLTSRQHFNFRFAFPAAQQPEEKLKKLARTAKRIAAIKYDHDDYLKEHGIATFGFGFPLLVRKNAKDPSKYIAAPVFIFPLDIKQSFDQSGEWIVSRHAESEIRLNEMLVAYLESEEHIKLPAIAEEMLEDGLLDKNELESFCRELLTKFADAETVPPSWESPDIIPDKIDKDTPGFEKTRIIWSGVFGIYKSQKQSLIRETELLLSDFDHIMNVPAREADWPQVHSPMPVDPSQNGVLRSLKNNRNLVIQGPPGTGKSQTLTAIIASALANKKKVLVVCEKRTALDVLKTNLEKLVPETAACIGLIEDVTKDRAVIVETVRNRTAGMLAARHQLAAMLAEDVARFEAKASAAEQQYEWLRKPVWRNMKWADLVSKWISVEKTRPEIDALYALQRNFKELEIDDTAYGELATVIDEASVLFRKARAHFSAFEQSVKPPHMYEAGAEREYVYALKTIAAKIGGTRAKLLQALEDYKMFRRGEIVTALENGHREMLQLQQLIDTHSTSGTDLFRISAWTKIKAVFSGKYKNILAAAGEAATHLQNIQAFFRTWWNEGFSPGELGQKRSFLAENITAEATALLQAERLSLNASLNPASGFDRAIWAGLEAELSAAGSELSSLISVNTVLPAGISVTDAVQAAGEWLQQVNGLLAMENNLHEYFAWKAFVAKVTPPQQAWIALLMGKDPAQWKETVAEAWLYYKLINEDKNGRFPADESSLDTLKDLGQKIKEQQKEIIKTNLNEWLTAGQQKIKAKGLQVNQLFNLRGAKGGKRNSLRTIINTDVGAFTDFFPVLMLNPSTCSSLLPLSRDLFDVVIFDEASQLRIEDTFGAMLRGVQVVVSGDSQQMPPSAYFESSRQLVDDDTDDEEDVVADTDETGNGWLMNNNAKDMAWKESLLEFAIDMGFKETYLDMHYRSRHPDLIGFSNVCFYNSRLIPMPAKDATPPIKYIYVNGLYEKRQNESEAREVIRIISEELNADQSVGVATFNLEQRNLILDMITGQMTADAAFRAKMELLYKQGFFVKNLENIQGDERDVILISTTFGMKKDGRFTMNFGPVTQRNGHRLLNVIITRAKHKLYILTSVPEARTAAFRDRLDAKRTVDGTTGLLGYLAYAKAVSADDLPEKQAILDFIHTKTASATIASGNTGIAGTSFEEAVYNWLAGAIGKERISRQYRCGGFSIHMVVMPGDDDGNSRKVAIDCDGAAYHSDQLTWHYDIFRQEQLENNNFVFHRIWSANWWRKPEEAFQQLLAAVNRID